jgi:dTDP-4-amino-4,6-dideoxygalactose transaminase
MKPTSMREVPFLDLRAQYAPIAEAVQRELREVCESGSFILGPKVEAFEDAFARSIGVRHCVALNSGTSALHLAMASLEIGPGDEVIVPAMTFIATAWGAMYNHARVVLVDVDPVTRTMDPARLEAAITSRTRAIIPVHLYGQAADLDAIMAIAGARGIPVIEDAAQAHLATHNGRTLGSIGLMGCFSFYPGKNLGAYGEGGAIVTNDSGIDRMVRALRDHGQTECHRHDELGYNYRMDGFQGAVLNMKLKHLPRWSSERRAVAARYNEHLAPLAERGLIEIPQEPSWSCGVWHLYVVLVRDRDQVKEAMTAASIGVGLHYPVPLHLQKALAAAGNRRGDFPASERIADRCLSLPIFPELACDDVDYVAGALSEIITRAAADRRQ